MKNIGGIFPLAILGISLGCGRPSESKNQSGTQKGAFEESSHYSDEFFSFDYPSNFNASGTSPKDIPAMKPNVSVELRVPLRASTIGALHINPDRFYPDMMIADAAATSAKEIVQQAGRALGGVRKLAVKNGSCFGYVQVARHPESCPDTAGFKVSGECYRSDLVAYCESPSHKHFMVNGALGFIPTPDRLTPEAAQFGKIHERILSTLEFK